MKLGRLGPHTHPCKGTAQRVGPCDICYALDIERIELIGLENWLAVSSWLIIERLLLEHLQNALTHHNQINQLEHGERGRDDEPEENAEMQINLAF